MFLPLSGAVTTSWGPGQVVIGDGAASQTGEVLERIGVKHGPVLFVTDQQIRRLGLQEDAVDSLKHSGYKVDIFSEISGEPDIDIAERVVATVRARSYQAVVGFGGGSAMDMAKVAAAMATNPGDVADIIGVDRVRERALPFVLIPTTAGTGAEASRVAMVTRQGRKAFIGSPHLVADAAILDATLSVSLPPPVTASTGLDALSHALEAYLSSNATPISATASLAAIRLIRRWLPVVYEDGRHLEGRRAMLFAAFLGGLALNGGAILGHSLAYTIANRTGLAHGLTCAMSLPYCIAYNMSAAKDRLTAVAAEVGLNEQQPEAVVLWLADLIGRFGIPGSLREIGLREEQIPEMVDELLRYYPRPNNPVPLDSEPLTQLYKYFYVGALKDYLMRVMEAA